MKPRPPDRPDPTGESGYPYKNHINADVEHGFIRDYAVTPAATHDSQALPELLDITQRGQPLYADSAYRSAATARRCKDDGLIHRVMQGIPMAGATEIATFDNAHSHATASMNSWGYLRL